jgi:hypothetical protein
MKDMASLESGPELSPAFGSDSDWEEASELSR